jgi:hypothetical protein
MARCLVSMIPSEPEIYTPEYKENRTAGNGIKLAPAAAGRPRSTSSPDTLINLSLYSKITLVTPRYSTNHVAGADSPNILYGKKTNTHMHCRLYTFVANV